MPLKDIAATEIEISSSGEEDAFGATSSPGSSVSQQGLKLIMDELRKLQVYFDCTMMQNNLVYIFLIMLDSLHEYIHNHWFSCMFSFDHLHEVISWTLIGECMMKDP